MPELKELYLGIQEQVQNTAKVRLAGGGEEKGKEGGRDEEGEEGRGGVHHKASVPPPLQQEKYLFMAVTLGFLEKTRHILLTVGTWCVKLDPLHSTPSPPSPMHRKWASSREG